MTRYLPHLIAAGLLAFAYDESNPYGYYVFLRWVVCPVFAWFAFQAHDGKRHPWVWIYGVTAALYNPIATAHLGRDLWEIVNALTLLLLAINAGQQRSDSIARKSAPQ